MSSFVDLTKQRYGRLIVLRRYGYVGKKITWLCLCDCGNHTVVARSNLRSNSVRSCGCLAKELKVENATTHGLSGTKAYKVWGDMMYRCYNKESIHYCYYGGRGIIVCKRWHDPSNFMKDMGQPPKGLTIERIYNDGPYAKWNCKWATRSEQNKNKGSRSSPYSH